MTNNTPSTVSWCCDNCDASVDAGERIDHMALPEHTKSGQLGMVPDVRSNVSTLDGAGLKTQEEHDHQETGQEEDGDQGEGDRDGEETKPDDKRVKQGGARQGEDSGANPMRWTCNICTVTVNIFARDDHLRSRPHVRKSRLQSNNPPTPLPQHSPPPTWHCNVCDEGMSVFHQADHLTAKQHLRRLRNQHPENYPDLTIQPESSTLDHPSPIPLEEFPIASKSSLYKFRNTFYCTTCAAEFDFSMQDHHLDTTDTWDCAGCAASMHPDARDQHLLSDFHHRTINNCEGVIDDFYCHDCKESYDLALQTAHFTGPAHQTKYFGGNQDLVFPTFQRASKSLVEKPTRITRPVKDTAPQVPSLAFCAICKQWMEKELLSSHLVWHFSNFTGPTAAAKPPQPTQPTNLPILHVSTAIATATVTAIKTAKPVLRQPVPEYITISGTTFHCKPCGRERQCVGMTSHVNCKPHKKRVVTYLAMLSVSPLALGDSPIIASSSQPAVASSGPAGPEADSHRTVCKQIPQSTKKHENSRKHRLNAAAAGPEKSQVYCDVCKFTGPAAGMASHMTSPQHLGNVAGVC